MSRDTSGPTSGPGYMVFYRDFSLKGIVAIIPSRSVPRAIWTEKGCGTVRNSPMAPKGLRAPDGSSRNQEEAGSCCYWREPAPYPAQGACFGKEIQ